MQLYMRRYGSNVITAGADNALLAYPLPNGSTFNFMDGECHVISSNALTVSNAMVYGAQGWLLQAFTIADFDAIDTLWDSMVPKDNDTLDLDTSEAVDANSFFELEQLNVSQLLDVEVGGPERFFNRHKMMTALNMTSPLWTTGGGNTIFHNDMFEVNMKRKYHAKDDLAILFGVGSPDMADVGASAPAISSPVGSNVDAFFMLKHIEDFMDKAMLAATPFIETGAESPYEDILNFLLETLEKVNENGTALFTGGSFHVFAKATAGIRTPGRMAHTSMGPDSQAQ